MRGKILRTCELANKTTEHATQCMDDHHSKEEDVGSVGELSTVCSQIVLKCLYLARSIPAATVTNKIIF